jgi:putative oxidoreductase
LSSYSIFINKGNGVIFLSRHRELSPDQFLQEIKMTNQNSSADYAALILRVSLGAMFIAHASLKIFVFTPEGAAGFFSSLGVPASFAYLTMAAEIIGGSALILGIYTRYFSLALLPVLIGSIVLVHSANGWLFSNPNGGWEYPAFLSVASLASSLLGDGAYALGKNLRQPFFTPQTA